MTPSKTLSLRLAPVLHDRLTAEAATQGVTVSALAVRCLLLGLDLPPPPPPPDGLIVAAVAALFAELTAEGAELDLQRELALVLARAAEQERGQAQVGAVRELLAVVRDAVGEADEAWQAFRTRLATPRMTDEHGNVIDAPSPNGSGPSKEQP